MWPLLSRAELGKIWPTGQEWAAPVFVNEVSWNATMRATASGKGACETDGVACKAKTIYCLVLCRKCGLTPGLYR